MGGNTGNKSLSRAPSVFTINYHIRLMGGSDQAVCSRVYTVSSRIIGTILEQIKNEQKEIFRNHLCVGVLRDWTRGKHSPTTSRIRLYPSCNLLAEENRFCADQHRSLSRIHDAINLPSSPGRKTAHIYSYSGTSVRKRVGW